MRRAALHEGQLRAGPLAVEYRAITPGGWDGAASLPLLLVLHGASSSAAILEDQLELYGGLWSAGAFPEVVVACASTPTAGGFYIDRPAAPWETAIAAPGAFQAWLAGGAAGAMPPVDFGAPEGAAALRLLEAERQAVAARDPEGSRRFGWLRG